MNKLALFLVAGLAALAALAADVPYLSGRVVDNAEILGAETKLKLAEQLKAHEAETGNQIAVLTVPSLEGESVESYAEQVFNAWKLGQKGKDNGVLVLVAPDDRRMRIEVGYGLEGTLTDVAASRIVRNVMTPRFKEGNFDAGVAEGVAAVIGQLTGAEAPPAEAPPAAEAKSDNFFDGPDLSLTERILIGAFIFGIIGLFTVLGILTPGMGWFLYVFLIPFWAMFPIVVVGTTGALWLLGTYLVGFPIAKLIVSRMPWYEKAKRDIKTKGTASIGGFTVGGSSGGSSWSSGSSSSGGGFSGGGGSSGGGGASGSW
ncbi:MAG: TPM domain-containing protein [Denitratisoma sp.]|nr:TPM domain-containing protein [Denitratisoma sp.]